MSAQEALVLARCVDFALVFDRRMSNTFTVPERAILADLAERAREAGA